MTPEMGMSIDDLVAVPMPVSKQQTSSIVIGGGRPNGGAYEIAKRVKEKTDTYETRITVLGHLQRVEARHVSTVSWHRLGVAAVAALAVHNDVMAGVIDDKIELTPFEIAISTKAESTRTRFASHASCPSNPSLRNNSTVHT